MDDKEFAQYKSDVITDALKSIGNGDLNNGRHIVLMLAARLRYARKLHPKFPDNGMTTYDVIEEEWREFSYEILQEDYSRARDEAMDVMATLTRFLLNEDLGNGTKKHS